MKTGKTHATKKEWVAARPKTPAIPTCIPTLTEGRLFDPKTNTIKFVPPRGLK